MATRTKMAGKRKTARKSAKSAPRKAASKRGGRKMAAGARKRGTPRKATARKGTTRGAAQVARVKRVASEVVQQAQVAVAAGVETLKDFGENLMDRVRTT